LKYNEPYKRRRIDSDDIELITSTNQNKDQGKPGNESQLSSNNETPQQIINKPD